MSCHLMWSDAMQWDGMWWACDAMWCGWLCVFRSGCVMWWLGRWCGDPCQKVLQSTTPYHQVLPCSTLYYKVLPRTTKYYSVLQGTTEYKVLQKYYSVPPNTSPYYKLQLCTSKYDSALQTTIPYYKALQSITPHRKVLLCTAKYYKVLQTGVTLQHHFLLTPPLAFFEYDSSFPRHSSSNSTRLWIPWIILV